MRADAQYGVVEYEGGVSDVFYNVQLRYPALCTHSDGCDCEREDDSIFCPFHTDVADLAYEIMESGRRYISKGLPPEWRERIQVIMTSDLTAAELRDYRADPVIAKKRAADQRAYEKTHRASYNARRKAWRAKRKAEGKPYV